MSVTEVKLAAAGASGKASGKAGTPEQVELTANYHVVAGRTDTALDVLLHFKGDASLPWMGRPFSYAGGVTSYCVCDDVDAQPIVGSEGRFTVAAKFSSQYSGGDDDNSDGGKDKNGNKTDDPTQWHDDIEVSTTQVSIPIEYATYIGPIPANDFLKPGKTLRDPCNSAGVPFDPLPEYELDITVLRITKYVRDWDDTQIAKYRGTINNDHFVINKPDYNFSLTVSPFVGKMKQFSGSFHFQDNIKYWKHTIELHINPLGWRFPLLDRGTTKTVRDDDPTSSTYGDMQPKRIVDTDGIPLTEPQKLDGNGGLLRPGRDPVYLLYAKYEEVPYGNITW